MLKALGIGTVRWGQEFSTSNVRAGWNSIALVLAASLLVTAEARGDAAPGSAEAGKGELLAFPGAEGFGRFARGGRGGQVVIVDTLEDEVSANGKTSLREALEVIKGARTIVFNVGGTFETGQTHILMAGEGASNVTLACQSAPPPGVLIHGNGIRIRSGAHDIVMQHCGIRNLDPGAPEGESSRTIGIIGGERGSNNLIFDHMSLGWATDENFTAFVAADAEMNQGNITLSRSIVAEGDADSSHPESGQLPNRYIHAMGPSCASASERFRVTRCSIIGNLLANNSRRNPLLWGMSGELANNVMYNWHETAIDARPHRAGRIDLHAWGNLLKAGPTTRPDKDPLILAEEDDATSNFRAEDNRLMAHGSSEAEELDAVSVGTPDVERNTVSAFDAACVGASRPVRGEWDARIVSEYESGEGQVGIGTDHERRIEKREETYHPLDRDRDLDGMADAWEQANGLDPRNPKDHKTDPNGDGYTALEAFLAELARC